MSSPAQTTHTHTVRSSRSAAEIFALVSDPSSWPRWNAAVGCLTLHGPFATGTTGTLTPPAGQPLPFVLVEVLRGRGYTSETTIASTVGLRSSIRLEPVGEGTGTLVTQCSELTGPAAEHFAPAFGDALVTGVETTVSRLAGTVS